MRLNERDFEIVGVAPKSYTFLWNDVDVYLPAAFTAPMFARARSL